MQHISLKLYTERIVATDLGASILDQEVFIHLLTFGHALRHRVSASMHGRSMLEVLLDAHLSVDLLHGLLGDRLLQEILQVVVVQDASNAWAFFLSQVRLNTEAEVRRILDPLGQVAVPRRQLLSILGSLSDSVIASEALAHVLELANLHIVEVSLDPVFLENLSFRVKDNVASVDRVQVSSLLLCHLAEVTI